MSAKNKTIEDYLIQSPLICVIVSLGEKHFLHDTYITLLNIFITKIGK